MIAQSVQVVSKRCPACNTPLDEQRFDEVEANLRKRTMRLVEQELREKTSAIEREAAQHAEARVLQATQERDRALLSAKETEENAAASVHAAVESALKQASVDWSEKQEGLLAERAAASAQAEQLLRNQLQELQLGTEALAGKIAEANEERDAALRKAHDAEQAVSIRVKEATEAAVAHARREAEEVLTKNAQAVKEAQERASTLEKERDAALSAARDAQQSLDTQLKEAVETATAAVRVEAQQALTKTAATAREAQEKASALEKERDAAIQRASKAEEQAAARAVEAVRLETAKVRQTLEQEHERVLAEKDAETARQHQALQKSIVDLQRQHAQKTANELGEGAEIDLFETLKESFPEDHVTRIKKGEQGADIKLEVRHSGEVCGLILIDSKNRKSWRQDYAAKLRKDQVEAGADHAILSSAAFPEGKKQICHEAEVLVATPARVVELARILRADVIKCYRLAVSNRQRSSKREALYNYVSSDDYRLRTGEVSRLNQGLQNLDVEEQKTHQNMWRRRGMLMKQQENALREVDIQISAILQGNSAEEEAGHPKEVTP